MLMNSNDLLIKINRVLEESGIIDDVTDFYHEHPEYFTKCSDGVSEVTGCEITLAMVCTPQERADAGVFILSNLGAHDAVQVEMSDHTRSTHTDSVEIKRTINGKEVSRYVRH